MAMADQAMRIIARHLPGGFMKLVCEQLGKKYGQHEALRTITFACEPGVIGLLGPNGAGKTTLMRILATLLRPSTGQVSWNGVSTRLHPEKLRQSLGYLPQDFGLYLDLSAREFLLFMAEMKGLRARQARIRVDEVLELVNLTPDASKKLKGFSGGMKRRVGIAQALLNDPALLLVDEPTAGLDIEERVRFRTLLAGFAAQRIVILSTHIVSDVEAAANRLLLINQGQILADTTARELIAQAQGKVWSIVTDQATAGQLQNTFPVSGMVQTAGGVQLRLLHSCLPHPAAEPAEPSLEDAYLLYVHASQEQAPSSKSTPRPTSSISL
jgi:ABC-type multidrug transport system ATPase subunit